MNGSQFAQSRPSSAVRKILKQNEHGGFEFFVDRLNLLVHMRLWGVWTIGIGECFAEAILDTAKLFVGRRWSILAHSVDFQAQSPEVAKLRQAAMSRIRNMGCRKIAAIMSSVAYAQQFMRISEASQLTSGVFTDELAALQWIREDSSSRMKKSDPPVRT